MDGSAELGFTLNIDHPFPPQAETDRDPVWLPKADIAQPKHREPIDLPHLFASNVNLDYPSSNHLLQAFLDQVRAIIAFFDRFADVLGGDQVRTFQTGIVVGFTDHIGDLAEACGE